MIDYRIGQIFDCKEFEKNLIEVSGRKSLTEIGKDIGKHKSTISKWVNGEDIPPTKELLNISLIYNCSIDYLLGIEPINKNEPNLFDIIESLLKYAALNDNRKDAYHENIEFRKDKDYYNISISKDLLIPYGLDVSIDTFNSSTKALKHMDKSSKIQFINEVVNQNNIT